MKSEIKTYVKNNCKFDVYVKNARIWCDMYIDNEYAGRSRCSFAYFGKPLCKFMWDNSTVFNGKPCGGFSFLDDKDFYDFKRFAEKQIDIQNLELYKIELAEKIKEKTSLDDVTVLSIVYVKEPDVVDGQIIKIKINGDTVKVEQICYYTCGRLTNVESENKNLEKTLHTYFLENPVCSTGFFEKI